jgi:hypothetical protein
MERLGHVLWIGGGTGAGKTSIAGVLAERHGLQLYSYDWHDARDHSERIDPVRHPAMHAFRAMSMDERWVLRTPEVMARETIESSRERMELVIEDLLARPSSIAIVAEGFGFYPELIAPLLVGDRQAIWLVPTAEFRARALRERGWSLEGTRDAEGARANKLARDGLLTDHVRRSADSLGLRVIDVDGTRSLAEVTAVVADHFAPMLRSLAPVPAASDRSRDDALRLTLLRSFTPFIARCTRGHAVLVRVSERHGLAAHELGLLNSAYLVAGRSSVTERALRDAVPYLTRSRLGAEHWRPLIAAGLARARADGWVLTEAGCDAVSELYSETWTDVAKRSADPALVGRVGEILERLSHTVPLTSRARHIRERWGDAPATTLVRLYRAVWELSIHRDACFRVAWEAEGYDGPSIDVLTQVWDGASTVDGIMERIVAKQDRDRVRANLVLLEGRGDIRVAGDAVALTDHGRSTRDGIEARTDADYFEGWPSGARLQVLVDDFDALMRSLG